MTSQLQGLHSVYLHRGDVTRDNLQQRFFTQHRVNFSCYVTRVNLSRNIVQNETGNMHVTRDDFSRNPTRNILRIETTRVTLLICFF